jgi:hypothetical protein
MSVVRWVLAVIAALCLVGLVAFARNDPGVDDRDGDPEDVVATQSTEDVVTGITEAVVVTETTG